MGRCFSDERVDEIQLDAVIICPSVQRPPAQFRAVIDDQDIGIAPFSGHTFQHLDHPLARQREIRLDGRTFARAVVFQIGRAELTAICQRVAGEVERPALVGRNRAPGPFTALARDLLAFGAPQPQFRRENSPPDCFLILLNLRGRGARRP